MALRPVSDARETCVNWQVYVKPLREAKIISQQDMDTIFSNIETIHQIHQRLYLDLKPLFPEPEVLILMIIQWVNVHMRNGCPFFTADASGRIFTRDEELTISWYVFFNSHVQFRSLSDYS